MFPINLKFDRAYISCAEQTINSLQEVQEVFDIISSIPWEKTRIEAISKTRKKIYWQEAMNRIIEIKFEERSWEIQPVISISPRHLADFKKNKVFVEVQFGNSSTLYRDYYKFHYAYVNNIITLGVIIVPIDQYTFFPLRDPRSIGNMATYSYAYEHFEALPLQTPILLIGLKPEN